MSLETRLNPSETDIVNQIRMKHSKDHPAVTATYKKFSQCLSVDFLVP
jgi:hypothetical protein